jgi:hypothetical protein
MQQKSPFFFIQTFETTTKKNVPGVAFGFTCFVVFVVLSQLVSSCLMLCFTVSFYVLS